MMSSDVFEIRVCTGCGLRYPIRQGHSFGTRCPHCLGETRMVLEKSISEESPTREHERSIRSGNFAVLMDNIRSAWNVGSILRSADGFGFTHAYLCGITPTPENEAVKKTSLGAEGYVTWSHHVDAVKLVENLKSEGWKVYALEEHGAAKNIRSMDVKMPGENRLLIVGSEVTGVDPDLLKLCDEIVFIPMSGKKRSFNAAIAFSIAAFALVE